MIIAAVTCVRDEADIIEEWIAHHIGLGIQRIHIFDNGSEDQTRAKIDAIALHNPGVTVQSWQPDSGEPQKAAFAAGLALMQAEGVDWCAFLDADEFIVNGAADQDSAAAQESFADFLRRREAHAAIGLNWAVFGSSGHKTRPWGLVQEAFLRRSEPGFTVNRHIKSVVRPRLTKGVHHVHGFALDQPYFNADGQEIVWRTEEHGGPVQPFAYTENFPSLTGWRINHYFCRWRGRWEEKVRLSRLREVFWRSEQDWQHHDRNEVLDLTALRWAKRDRALLESWSRQSAEMTQGDIASMLQKPKSCLPNPFGTVPFIFGWEGAFLGNCLSSLANMVAFSIRNSIPAIYPNIESHSDIFADPSRSRSVFDPDQKLHSDRIGPIITKLNRYFQDYYPGYEREIARTDFAELSQFRSMRGSLLFLPYHRQMEIREWSEDRMEEHAAAFCRRGNGLVLPGAFWNQYTDMREASAYGPALRAHIGSLREDRCEARVAHMQAHRDHLRIAIHIRQSDSRTWQGGAYYYEIEDYRRVIAHLHHSLTGRPHVFYVFSEVAWTEDDFAGLPVFVHPANFGDDFVTMGRCDFVIGPPSTFATWSAFLGGARRVILTKPRLAALSETPSLLDFAVDIPFPTGAYLPGDPAARPV